MVILSKKQVDEILVRITACQIMTDAYMTVNVEAYTKMTENLADIAVEVGGPKGAKKVIDSVHQYEKVKHGDRSI